MSVVSAQSANARNNADHQHLRLDLWSDVRDAAWAFIDPLLEQDATVLIVGAGNGDDLPLARIADRARRVTLADIDADAVGRSRSRLSDEQRARIDVELTDITDGSVDRVLGSIRTSWWRPRSITPPRTPITAQRYDLVISDMLYTQLLHPGLIALGLPRAQQLRMMQRYDATLRDALIARLHASARPGGTIVHIHDLACWTTQHPQPLEFDDAVAQPEAAFPRLRRHDACDPLIGEAAAGSAATNIAWWPWRFEPNTSYLVRACSLPARST